MQKDKSNLKAGIFMLGIGEQRFFRGRPAPDQQAFGPFALVGICQGF